MIRIWKTSEEGRTEEIDTLEPGSWVVLVDPEPQELTRVRLEAGIELADMRDALDPEEKSRIEVDEDYTMVIVDVPVAVLEEEGHCSYTTIPLSIIDNGEILITTCLEDLGFEAVLRPRKGLLIKSDTTNRTRMMLQILSFFVQRYQRYLTDIDKERQRIEDKALSKPNDDDFVELYRLSRSLVYFRISLTSNKAVLDKLFDPRKVEEMPEVRSVFDDVVIETGQAIEMTNIYAEILKMTIDQLEAVLNHHLNSTMRLLTIFAVIMAVPTVIAGFFGMNLEPSSIPLSSSPNGFALVVIFNVVVCLVLIVLLQRRK